MEQGNYSTDLASHSKIDHVLGMSIFAFIIQAQASRPSKPSKDRFYNLRFGHNLEVWASLLNY